VAAPHFLPHPLSVLVVEGPDPARSVVPHLRGRGHEVRTAPDGPTALHLARERAPDVAVLDLDLPDLDGGALAGGLARLSAARGPVVVGLTARGWLDWEPGWSRADIDVFVCRPAGGEALLRVLDELRRTPPAPSVNRVAGRFGVPGCCAHGLRDLADAARAAHYAGVAGARHVQRARRDRGVRDHARSVAGHIARVRHFLAESRARGQRPYAAPSNAARSTQRAAGPPAADECQGRAPGPGRCGWAGQPVGAPPGVAGRSAE
jgi:DNA-binding response OmpR family regulator